MQRNGLVLTALLVCAAWLLFGTVGAFAAPVKNADIVKLIEAGMSDDLILNVIRSGEVSFDTSADALVSLKKKGASEKVIGAMVGAAQRRSGSDALPPRAIDNPLLAAHDAQMSGQVGFGEVTMLDNGSEVQLLYTRPGSRSKVRALGFGGVGMYYVLQGSAAKTRTANKSPEFVVALDANSHPEGQAQLSRWEVRPNGTREILSINAVPFGSATSGMPKERIVALTYTKLPDQSRASMGKSLYSLRPVSALAAGEYALVVVGGSMVFEVGIDP